MNQNTFCILPFRHLYSDPDGSLRACCISKPFKGLSSNIKNFSIDQAFNSQEFIDLRKDLISGNKNSLCTACWSREETGGKSQRMYSNEIYGYDHTMKEDGTVDPNFLSIHVRFSNLCNFKCVMCGHWLSSSHWDKEKQKQGIPKVIYIKDNIVEELIPYLTDLEEVYFGGGEPLIMPEHLSLLQYLAEYNTDIRIKYTTNLSTFKPDIYTLIELWAKFKHVHVQVSIDGLFEKGEKIRVGLKTDKFIENIKILKDNKVNYSLSYTTGNYNVLDIYEFISNVKELEIVESEDQIELFNYVTSPSEYSIKNMTKEETEQAIEYLKTGIIDIKADFLKSQIIDMIKFIEE